MSVLLLQLMVCRRDKRHSTRSSLQNRLYSLDTYVCAVGGDKVVDLYGGYIHLGDRRFPRKHDTVTHAMSTSKFVVCVYANEVQELLVAQCVAFIICLADHLCNCMDGRPRLS
jgi:hypothetical protein